MESRPSGAETRVAVGTLVFIVLLVALVTLFVRALSASFPDDPFFAVPGDQSRRLSAGGYVSQPGGDHLPTRIRVTGPGGKAVAVDTTTRGPNLTEPGEGEPRTATRAGSRFRPRRAIACR